MLCLELRQQCAPIFAVVHGHFKYTLTVHGNKAIGLSVNFPSTTVGSSVHFAGENDSVFAALVDINTITPSPSEVSRLVKLPSPLRCVNSWRRSTVAVSVRVEAEGTPDADRTVVPFES